MFNPFHRAIGAFVRSLILFLAFAAASLLLFWAALAFPIHFVWQALLGLMALLLGYAANWLWGQVDIDFWALSLYRKK